MSVEKADKNPAWNSLKKLWLKLKIAKGRGDILEAQKIAKGILECQEKLEKEGVKKSDFTELLNVVLWE